MGFKLRDIAATAGRYVRQAARMAGRGASPPSPSRAKSAGRRNCRTWS